MKRTFYTNEFYHLFDRGVEKRKIFYQESDKIRFIHNLYEFNDLKPAPAFSRRFNPKKNVRNRVSYISSERKPLINLHAFVLMPNHYHLLSEQIKREGISLFMRKINVGHTNSTNLKYKRSGHLFQGPFKHVYIGRNFQLAHLVCYLHSNPLDIWKPNWKERRLSALEMKKALKFLESYRWSSHLDYLGIKNFPSLINTEFLFKFFGGPGGYRKFFIDWLKQYLKNIKSVNELILE